MNTYIPIFFIFNFLKAFLNNLPLPTVFALNYLQYPSYNIIRNRLKIILQFI